jgi:hypothetical protein
MPKVHTIFLGQNPLGGALPASWGAPGSFPGLSMLDLGQTGLAGELPAMHCANLTIVNFSNTNITGCGAVWGSTSPLWVLDVSSSSLAGTLPPSLGASFTNRTFMLNVDRTALSGVIPTSWLGPNAVLSRIIFKGPALWDKSVHDAAWRSAVCVEPELFGNDAGLKASDTFAHEARLLSRAFRAWSLSAHSRALLLHIPILKDVVSGDASSQYGGRASDFCQIPDADRIIAGFWGVFLAAFAAILIGYHVHVKRMGNRGYQGGWPSMAFTLSLGKRPADLLSLLLYTYDLGKDITVLSRVWGIQRWYGFALLAVMVGHHACHGFVTCMFLTRGYSAARPRDLVQLLMRCAYAVFCIPSMVVITLLLDVYSFVVSVLGLQSPAEIDVDSYADLRSVAMGLLQSLPVAIMTTYIFRAGNSPSYGEYFSPVVAAFVLLGSGGSMLVGLLRLLAAAHAAKQKVLWTLVCMLAGKLLRPGAGKSHAWMFCRYALGERRYDVSELDVEKGVNHVPSLKSDQLVRLGLSCTGAGVVVCIRAV